MIITTTELKKNQGKYLSLASREDLVVIKRGRPIAKIIGVRLGAVRSIERVFGVLPKDYDERAAFKERALSI